MYELVCSALRFSLLGVGASAVVSVVIAAGWSKWRRNRLYAAEFNGQDRPCVKRAGAPPRYCDDRAREEAALCHMIEIVSDGEWPASSTATRHQAYLFMSGVKGVDIADITLQAAALAASIGRTR